MSTDTITVAATLHPDGVTLQLEEKLALPPGRVTVTVQTTRTMADVLERIHLGQQQRGRKRMTEEEMAQEIAQTRAEDDGYEERCQEIWARTERS